MCLDVLWRCVSCDLPSVGRIPDPVPSQEVGLNLNPSGVGRAGHVITPDDVFDVLEEDLARADMVLWVGISFEQSASTAYFRRVRRSQHACLACG